MNNFSSLGSTSLNPKIYFFFYRLKMSTKLFSAVHDSQNGNSLLFYFRSFMSVREVQCNFSQRNSFSTMKTLFVICFRRRLFRNGCPPSVMRCTMMSVGASREYCNVARNACCSSIGGISKPLEAFKPIEFILCHPFGCTLTYRMWEGMVSGQLALL